MAAQNLQQKNLDTPDETRTFEKGKVEIVSIDEVAAGRFTLEPGWRWSEAEKPIVGTDSCQVLHTGYVISGRMHLLHDDGSEQVAGGSEYRESVRDINSGAFSNFRDWSDLASFMIERREEESTRTDEVRTEESRQP